MKLKPIKPHYNIIWIAWEPLEYYIWYMAELEYMTLIFDGRIIAVEKDPFSKIWKIFIINIWVKNYSAYPDQVRIYKEEKKKVFIK